MMRPTAVDLFCGAGGLSLGLDEAGFDTVMAIDQDPDSCATYRTVLTDVEVHCADARTFDFHPWRGVDIVAGGPPCQPFSSGGLRRGWADDRDLLSIYVRAVLEIAPRAFLLENVPGLGAPRYRDYLFEILNPLISKYNIHGPAIINAADYGVPQSRRRLMIIGTRENDTINLNIGKTSHVPAATVIGHSPIGDPNTSKIVYAKNPDLRPDPYHGQLFNGGGRAINLMRPAPTILASAGGNKTHFVDVGGLVPAYHSYLMKGGLPRTGCLPDARRLTIVESALLQSFPTHMTFFGSRSSQYTQIGNAVPPPLACAFGREILTTFGGVTQKCRAA